MMKKLLLWLLIATPFFTNGQNINGKVDLSNYYTKSQVDSMVNRIGVQTPVVTLKPCKRSPTITSISEITSTGAYLQFDADSVFKIKYWISIQQNGPPIYTDSLKPNSNTVPFKYPSLANGSYYLNITGQSCSSGVSDRKFIVSTSTGETLVKCKEGPETRDISNVSGYGLTFLFNAKDVTKLRVQIYSEANLLMYDNTGVEPKSNTVTISYPTLSPGQYRFVLSGVNCSGISEGKYFTVPTKPVVEVPPVSTPDPPIGGVNPMVNIAKGFDDHLKITSSIVDGVRRFTDMAKPDIGSNYNLWYLHGNNIYKGSQLENFRIDGNNPTRIVKVKIKNGINEINQWTDKKEEENGYYHFDAGEGFSYNTSFAYETMFFPGPQDEKGFLNHVPQGYDPSIQNVQWADIMPDMKLPSGHFWVQPWQGWTTDIAEQKGVTSFAHHSLPWNNSDGNKKANALKLAGKTYSNVPRIESVLHLTRTEGEDDFTGPGGINKRWWPNGPFDAATSIQKANETDISDAVFISEMSENVSFMYPSAEMWFHYYKRLRERYDETFGKRGIKYLIGHDYLNLLPREIQLTKDHDIAHYKAMLRMSANELPKSNFSPGGSLSYTNLIVSTAYFSAPDGVTDYIPQTVFQFQINKALGYESGVFLAGVHEYRPNNYLEVRYPDGKFYYGTKVPLDPALHIAAGFIAQVHGSIYIEWGGASKSTTKSFDKYNFDQGWSNFKWFPNTGGESENFTHWKKDGEEAYYGYTGSTDLSAFSQRLYNMTFGQVSGGQSRYLRYRIDGGEWFNPSSYLCDEVVDAFFERRGYVYSETKDAKEAWYYINPYADAVYHTLDVELQSGKVVSQKVAGIGIHARLEK